MLESCVKSAPHGNKVGQPKQRVGCPVEICSRIVVDIYYIFLNLYKIYNMVYLNPTNSE